MRNCKNGHFRRVADGFICFDKAENMAFCPTGRYRASWMGSRCVYCDRTLNNESLPKNKVSPWIFITFTCFISWNGHPKVNIPKTFQGIKVLALLSVGAKVRRSPNIGRHRIFEILIASSKLHYSGQAAV